MASLTDLIRPSFKLFTTVFYGFLIYVLLKGRKTIFSSSFFLLFASTGIADMLFLLLRVLMMDMTSLFFTEQWISLANELPTAAITYGLTWCFCYAQILGLLAISINRFSAVAMPVWYQALWTSGKVKVVILLQWILPILWTLPLFHPCCQIIFFDDNDTSSLSFVDDTVNNIYSIIDIILEGLVFVPVVVLINFMTVFVSIKNRKKANLDSESVRARKNSEMRLSVVGVIISMSYISSVIFSALFDLAISEILPIDASEMINWYYNSFDVFTLSNPYILLLLSGVARTEFFHFIGCKNDKSETNNQSVNVRAITVRQLKNN